MNVTKRYIVPGRAVDLRVLKWLAVIVIVQCSLNHFANAQVLTSLEEKKAVVDQKIMDYLAMITKIEQDYACWIETETFSISDGEDGIKKDYWGQFYAANAKNGWKYWSRRTSHMGNPGPSPHWYRYIMSKDGTIKARLGLRYPPHFREVLPSDEIKPAFFQYLAPTMWCELDSSNVEAGIATQDFIRLVYITDIGPAKDDGRLKLTDLEAEASGDLLATWSASRTQGDGLKIAFTKCIRLDKEHGLPITLALKVKYNDVERVVSFTEIKCERVVELHVPSSICRVEENAKGDKHTETQQKLKWILGDAHPDSNPAEESDDWRMRYCRLLKVDCSSER